MTSFEKSVKELQAFIQRRGFYPFTSEDERVIYKTEFKKIGTRFLRETAKELKLAACTISYNKAGIAVSGDHSLIGMTDRGAGIYISFNADKISHEENTFFLYRTVKHIKDYSGGPNRWAPIYVEPEKLLLTFRTLIMTQEGAHE